MSQSNLLISGKIILREEIRIKKDHVQRPKQIPERLELALIDFEGAIHLSVIMEDTYFTIDKYYNKNQARKEYKKIDKKIRNGDYEVELGFEIKGIKFK